MQFGRPGLERQAVFEGRAQVPELAGSYGQRNNIVRSRSLWVGFGRRGRARRPLILPDPREIRVAVRGPRRGSRQVRLAVGGLGDSWGRIIRPLREQRRRQGQKCIREMQSASQVTPKYSGAAPLSNVGAQRSQILNRIVRRYDEQHRVGLRAFQPLNPYRAFLGIGTGRTH